MRFSDPVIKVERKGKSVPRLFFFFPDRSLQTNKQPTLPRSYLRPPGGGGGGRLKLLAAIRAVAVAPGGELVPPMGNEGGTGKAVMIAAGNGPIPMHRSELCGSVE